ncbi:hypothetical protein PFISCL1PPCAC_14855 [Pristionchus fissidentatus]|uniref:glucuronosyltransferase n=1 Tax=Pristionchus fissidentatus TaxID=1538716 RepID=A0AAV5VYV6_9BILA|nr:hypothetical protein PFISCL1PPCAC_14855 [Pristionchus fissidentatus]
MRTLPLLFILLPIISSLNVLMYVNVIGKSHLQFAHEVIHLLNERGHKVDVIMGMLNSLVTLKGDYGARKMVPVHFPGESPWGASADHLNNPFEDNTPWNPLTRTFVKFIETTELLCDLILDSSLVSDLLTSNSYDVALMAGYDFCPFALAYLHKISPVLSYVPTPAVPIQTYYGGLPDLPLYENIMLDAKMLDRASFLNRLYDTVRIFKERYIHYNAYNSMNDKLRARFGVDFPDVREIVRNTSMDFSNSHPLLDEPKPMSQRLRYIGGVGLPTPKPLTKEFNDILSLPKKGNVLFSFGTQIEADKITEDLQRIFITTFKRFPEYNFLWKFDGETAVNASNVFNLKWLPQTDLLYDSRVVGFISHMGLNSFTETSFAGVPVVSIPLFADQIHNSLRALSLGTGVIVKKTEITVESLTSALEKILYDESYLNRSKEIASMISALPDTPQRILIEGIEFAAQFKNLPIHYRLAGADYNFLVQIGWDVAAFLTLLSLLLLYLTLKLSIVILRNIPVKLIAKNKLE